MYGKYYGEWDKLIKQNLMSSDVSGLSGDQVKSEFTAGRLAVYPSARGTSTASMRPASTTVSARFLC